MERLEKVIKVLRAMIDNKERVLNIFNKCESEEDKLLYERLRAVKFGLMNALWLLTSDGYLEAQSKLFLEEDKNNNDNL